jgi:hypothetical protein
MKGTKKKYGPKGFIPPDRNQRLAAVALSRLAAAKVPHSQKPYNVVVVCALQLYHGVCAGVACCVSLASRMRGAVDCTPT